MRVIQEFLEGYVHQWQEQRYLLAVSGGVDSMVLLHQFAEIFVGEKRQQLQVVHMNHQLREVSASEEQLVREACAELGIACVVYSWEEGKTITANIEEAARNFRYQKFEETMKDCEADYLVLAHHGDDQVETMIMKSVRTSTLKGLAGMRAVRAFAKGSLLRPFLSVTKQELIHYAEEHHLQYAEDESNSSPHYTRNRYRHQVIPLLRAEQPRLVEHFQQNAQLLQDCYEVLQPVMTQQFHQLMTIEEQGFSWSASEFERLIPAMQRLLLHELSEQMKGVFSYHHLQLIHQAIGSERAQLELHLPQNWRFQKIFDRCLLTTTQQAELFSSKSSYPLTLEDTVLQLSPQEELSLHDGNETDFNISVAREDFPLRIRHRRSGDRMMINQQGQHQSIRRWCINNKIPHAERDQLWLIENNQQKIIAILGYRGSQSLFNTSETDKIRIFYKKDNEVQEC